MASGRVVEDKARGLLETCPHSAPACWRCVALDMEAQRDAIRAALPEELRALPLVEAVRCLRDGLDAAQEAAFKCCSRNAWGDGEHDAGCRYAALQRELEQAKPALVRIAAILNLAECRPGLLADSVQGVVSACNRAEAAEDQMITERTDAAARNAAQIEAAWADIAALRARIVEAEALIESARVLAVAGGHAASEKAFTAWLIP